jgi:hypothetical protein
MADPAPQAPAAEGTPVAGATQDGGTTKVQFSSDPIQEAQQLTEGMVVDAGGKAKQEAPRPEGLPEGYDSWEAFGKAQLEAQKKGEDLEGQQKAPERSADLQQQIDALPEGVREKLSPVFDEFAQTGTLTEASIKAATEATGYPEAMIRAYMRGVEAINADATDQLVSPFYTAAGGKEAYEAFGKWATEGGYTPEQIAAFDAALDKGDTKFVSDAVAAWKASGNGPAPRDIAAGREAPRTTPADDGFKSSAEMTRAMSDPRYASDPAYRADVERRVGLMKV